MTQVHAPLELSRLPVNARNAIVRNVIGSPGPWVLVNLSARPAVVIPSGVFTRRQWIEALRLLQISATQAEQIGSPPEKST